MDKQEKQAHGSVFQLSSLLDAVDACSFPFPFGRGEFLFLFSQSACHYAHASGCALFTNINQKFSSRKIHAVIEYGPCFLKVYRLTRKRASGGQTKWPARLTADHDLLEKQNFFPLKLTWLWSQRSFRRGRCLPHLMLTDTSFNDSILTRLMRVGSSNEMMVHVTVTHAFPFRG